MVENVKITREKEGKTDLQRVSVGLGETFTPKGGCGGDPVQAQRSAGCAWARAPTAARRQKDSTGRQVCRGRTGWGIGF